MTIHNHYLDMTIAFLFGSVDRPKHILGCIPIHSQIVSILLFQTLEHLDDDFFIRAAYEMPLDRLEHLAERYVLPCFGSASPASLKPLPGTFV